MPALLTSTSNSTDLDTLFEERRDRFGVGDVKAKGTGFSARRHNVPGHGFSFISLADIGEIHLISGLRQRLRNSLADTSGAAGSRGRWKVVRSCLSP